MGETAPLALRRRHLALTAAAGSPFLKKELGPSAVLVLLPFPENHLIREHIFFSAANTIPDTKFN